MWFCAVGAVGFNIEVGHEMTCFFPEEVCEMADDDTQTEESELPISDLVFSAVPDLGADECLSPRTFDFSTSSGSSSPTRSVSSSGSSLGFQLQRHQFATEYKGRQVFGWSVYVQKQDTRRPRNAAQQAFFLLSPLPLNVLAYDVLESIARRYSDIVEKEPFEELVLVKECLWQHWMSFYSWPEPACCAKIDLQVTNPCMVPAAKSYQLPCFRSQGYYGNTSLVSSSRITLPRKVTVDSKKVESEEDDVRLSKHILLFKSFCAASAEPSMMHSEIMTRSESNKSRLLARSVSGSTVDTSLLTSDAKQERQPDQFTYKDSPLFAPLPNNSLLPFAPFEEAEEAMTIGGSAVGVALEALPETVRVRVMKKKRPDNFLFLDSPLRNRHLQSSSNFKKFNIPRVVCNNNHSNQTVAFQDYSIKRYLAPHLARIRKLWEIMIAGESMCVVADSSESASHAVVTLTNLIQPLTYVGQVLPYVTLQNKQSEEVEGLPEKGTIFGCTNPYFLKSLEGFDACLSLNTRFVNSRDLNKNHRKKRKRFAPFIAEEVDVERNDLYTDRVFSVLSPEEVNKRPAKTVRQMTNEFLYPLYSHISAVLEGGLSRIDEGCELFVGELWAFFFLATEPSGKATQRTRFANYPAPFSVGNLLEEVMNFLANHDDAQSMWKKTDSPLTLYHDFLHTPTCLLWMSQLFFGFYQKFLEQLIALTSKDATTEDREISITTALSADIIRKLQGQLQVHISREADTVVQDTTIILLLNKVSYILSEVNLPEDELTQGEEQCDAVRPRACGMDLFSDTNPSGKIDHPILSPNKNSPGAFTYKCPTEIVI